MTLLLPPQCAVLAARQDGVVSRAQLVAAGAVDHDVRRWVRRRLLVPVHRGVFVNHTGELSWSQRAWAAVLATTPSALDGWSALRASGLKVERPDDVVHVAVAASRRVRAPEGVVLRRVHDLEQRVRWSASPPRLRLEEAVLHVAATAADDLTAVGILTDAVQARHTTATRLRSVLDGRERWPRRAVLTDVLVGLEQGTHSVLEHAYLRRVEQAHGLPRGVRQGTLPGNGDAYDVLYEGPRVVVELDGRSYHSLARDRYRDLERDARVVRAGYLPLRLGWLQLLGTPCETARRIGEVFRSRGWVGDVRPCARCR